MLKKAVGFVKIIEQTSNWLQLSQNSYQIEDHLARPLLYPTHLKKINFLTLSHAINW